MNCKNYAAYQKNLKNSKNSQLLLIEEDNSIASLLIPLLHTKKLYLSRGYFNSIKNLFKKVSKNKIKDTELIITLEEYSRYPTLKIVLKTDIFENNYFVKEITSTGLSFIGDKQWHGTFFEIRMKDEF